MEQAHLNLSQAMPAEVRECPACRGRLTAALQELPGVVETAFEEGACLNVTFDPDLLHSECLRQAAKERAQEIARSRPHLRLKVAGADCADCVRTLEAGVGEIPGVESASFNLLAGTLLVEIQPEADPLPQIRRHIKALGYEILDEEGAGRLLFRVQGMDCADCAATLEEGLRRLPSVKAVQLDFGSALLSVETDNPAGALEDVRRRARELGYEAEPAEARPARTPREGWRGWMPQNAGERRTFLSGAAVALGGLAHIAGAPPLISTILFALAIVVGGYSIARAGWAALRLSRSPDMNVLMTIAVLGAAFIGAWAEAAMVVFLFSIGEMLEERSMDRARHAIQKLLTLSPPTALRISGGKEEKVLVEELRVGDRILVRPGERIPMDGEVIAGQSSVDQSPITGESLPVEKAAGEEVFAGSLNQDGALEIRVTRPASDNMIARIVQMVEEAQGQRAPSQRFVDRFASVYTPVVIALAIAVAAIPPLVFGAPFLAWLYRALTLLVIACPCALVISTPVAIVSAISNGARHGILVKGGRHVEEAGKLRAIAFDKTGTLTRGRPVVTDIIRFNDHPAEELLQIAASIENRSEHSLARAVVLAAEEKGIAALSTEDFQALVGRGARARIAGNTFFIGSPRLIQEYALMNDEAQSIVQALQASDKTVVLVATEDGCERTAGAHLIGALALTDEIRPEAPAAIRALRQTGIEHIIMLTGDHSRTAEHIAAQLGIDEVHAELLPQDKVRIVGELVQRYEKVGMVGDGINDAPALAGATLGIAMGTAGTDTALETADVALMSDDLMRIADLVELGRKTRRNIMQNVGLALAIKATFLILAVAGVATLWMAVFADTGTSLIVILNGMRLLRAKPARR